MIDWIKESVVETLEMTWLFFRGFLAVVMALIGVVFVLYISINILGLEFKEVCNEFECRVKVVEIEE